MTYQMSKYGGTFEDDWAEHTRDLVKIADNYETHAVVPAYFLRFSLWDDARKFYNHLKSSGANWVQVLHALNERYFYEDIQNEILGRLA